MGASSQYGRFGSGKAVRRVEDESLLTGTGSSSTTQRCRARRMSCSCARRYPHARIVGIDTSGRGRDAGRHRHRDRGRSSSRAGVKPLPTSAGFPARRRLADGGAAAPCARGRYRSLRRRSRRGRRRRNARAGARRAGGDRRALRRRCRASSIRPRPSRRAHRTVWAGGDGEHRRGDPPWRCRRDGEGVRECRARRRARSRQSAARAVPDRAARGARELRHRERTHHAARRAARRRPACATRCATRCSASRTTRCGCSSATSAAASG